MKGGNLVTQPGPIKVLSRRFAWLAFAPALAFAQGEQPGFRDFMQARNYAMGGAYRALGLGTEAIDGNPAAMGLRKRYEIDLGGALDTQTKFSYGSAAIYDTQTSELGAGVSYHLISVGRGDRNRIAHQATLALSYPLSQSIILGASGHYVLENGAFHRSGITMDAGLALKMSDSISASLSAHNLIDVKPSIFRVSASSTSPEATFPCGLVTPTTRALRATSRAVDLGCSEIVAGWIWPIGKSSVERRAN